MKFGSLVSAATKFGAVCGVLFFAIELQQNRRQLESQARYAQFEIQPYSFFCCC